MGRRLSVARNLLKVWLIFAAPAAAMAYGGWKLGGYRPSVLFGSSVALFGVTLYWYADRIAMGMVGARALAPGEARALQNTVTMLSTRAGVTSPKLYVIPDGYPRALSGGRGPHGGTALAVSTGLLAIASPAELEGIVAHELAHMRNRDVLAQTVAAILAVGVVEASRFGGRLGRASLAVLGPVGASVVHLMLSAKREFAADRYAAELCGSPHGLADALVRLETTMELVSFQANPATEPLHVTNPFGESTLAGLFATHPQLGERVQRLRDLDPDWRNKLRAA